MTAEIALLNRRALAFAADSAVTITDGVNHKIYNSAEKIFELSRISNIGIMLYNSLEFMGVPLDVLVRKFRNENDREYASCKEACTAFLDYLQNFSRHKVNEDNNVVMILLEEISDIAKEHRAQFRDFFRQYIKKNPPDFDAATRALLLKLLDEHTDTHLKRPLNGYLQAITVADVEKKYGDTIRDLIKRKLSSWRSDKDIENKIFAWALAAMRSDIFSDSLTGIVIGGFGVNELFPSLYSVEVDGLLFDVIKCKVTNDIDIDRRDDEQAKIIPFAQSEMAERFLFGLDSETQKNIQDFIKRSIERAYTSIEKNFNVDLTSLGLTADVYANRVNRFVDSLKKRSRDETLDMVDFMPKQELAYTAEAFITLTSIKRKVSAQQETVGGPIDVAIITQNEGFVWIKRKHYFEKELNPAYDVRSFVSMKRSMYDDRTPKAASRARSKRKTSA